MKPLEKLKPGKGMILQGSRSACQDVIWMQKVHTDSKVTAQIQYRNPLWFYLETKFNSDSQKSTESPNS